MENTAVKKAILNLEVKNFRKANEKDGQGWSKYHAECDVFLDGEFITTYKWNPGFYRVQFPKTDRDRTYTRDWAKKTQENLRKVVIYLCGKYGIKNAEKYYGIWLRTGKYWNAKFADESVDKRITDEIWEHIEPVYPDLYNVESALVRDAQCIESSLDFKDFCDNFGYSDDSMNALKIYAECQKIYALLVRSGKWKDLEILHEED